MNYSKKFLKLRLIYYFYILLGFLIYNKIFHIVNILEYKLYENSIDYFS